MNTHIVVYNKAIKAGIADRRWYPFEDYKIKTEPKRKRALEWNYLQNILELELSDERSCFHTRNYFRISYMSYGMNFTDMAYLKKENIKAGRIKYQRRKTSKLYDIKLTDGLKELFDYYLKQPHDSEFIFPILKRKTAIQQFKDIKWARKRYNMRLKELAELCNIPEDLTSYVSRHSFATQAMLKKVPLEAISSMLGHSSLKTTQVYLKSLPSNVLDDYNELIVSKMLE